MVKVMGIFTLGAVLPGLNFQRRKVLVADWSSRLFPMLWTISASVTAPLDVSTVTTHTPLPVMWRARAS